jgi:hypothetical protein
MIGMHGGLPPADSFPFSYFNAGISAAGHGPTDAELQIAEPQLVAAAQQYNMNAEVRARTRVECSSMLGLAGPGLVAWQ